MAFNSLDFAIFLPVVFAIYWLLNKKSLKTQNSFLLIASYFFYGYWDWRFLFLIFLSTLIDFMVGIALEKQQKKPQRKFLLFLSIFFNIGFLAFFKYCDFFIENFISAFSFFGFSFSSSFSLNIILPVGISFYTFQTLSYSIDVYKKKLKPTKDFIAFSAFVSFFPQLVAGPIERATNLLPQFYAKKKFDFHQGVDGLRQILWGLFKKIVIADNCAESANAIFNYAGDYPGSTLFLGGCVFCLSDLWRFFGLF